ncbi:hypothetical protein V1517DRAFT_326035 [Lipomyces orientalis]|uniref:Uncharacterized protein n=1 Tax=Lipomyces orientalis TaxID=1233043 RepID=A0ACC3TK62_9ASCO
MVASSYVSTKSLAVLPTDLLATDELDNPATARSIAEKWVSAFDKAITTYDADVFVDLFHNDGYWRDLIAFTNDYRGIAKINIHQAARDRLSVVKARDAKLTDPAPCGSRPFEGHSYIESRFEFFTELGPAFGHARIVKTEEGDYKAYVLMTCIAGVHDHEEQVFGNRLEGAHNSELTYAQIRQAELDNPEPSVLIVGAGHNGIDIAVRLKAYGIKSLLVDRNARVGDNWRSRYASLTLHDTLWGAQQPYLPFPGIFPRYLSAGMLGDWLELYVRAVALNVWTSSFVDPSSTKYDERTKTWSVTVLRNGVTRCTFKVSHIVMATGLGGGKPKFPPPAVGQDIFEKPIKHAFQHKSGAEYNGKKALVVGTGSSGHDIAFDLYNNGAEVVMLQRSPTFIMSLANGIEYLNKGLFQDNGPPIDWADEVVETLPKAVVKAYMKNVIPIIAEMDKDILAGLENAGFRTDFGPDGSGHIFLSAERNGGYYFDSGACEHIINGDIKIRPGEIDHFTKDSVVFKDGNVLTPDVVIFATGVTGFKESLAETLGNDYVKLLKPVWGLDEENELNSCFRDCGIPRVYFMVGALPLARFNSKIVAIQILAEQLGVFGERYSIDAQKMSAA